MFYGYREVAFERLINKVERKGRTLYLYEGDYTWRCLVPFPAAMFPNEEEKRAVLMYKTCNDAVAFMHTMMKVMLEGKPLQMVFSSR